LGPKIWLRDEISGPFLFCSEIELEMNASQEGANPVRETRINVLFVATVSAIVHGALAVVFVPLLSLLMLSFGALPAPLSAAATADHGMVLALVAPFGYAGIGFVFGGMMAFLFNTFIKMLDTTQTPLKVVVEPVMEAEGAALGDAA
jgi:hypothetical protein